MASSPAITDLNDDGVMDLVVGLMPTDESTAPATVVGMTAAGQVLFSKRTCTWAGKPCNVMATPAIGDVDGDGDDDIVVTSQDHYLHAWRDTGQYLPGFPVFLHDTSWASASLADLDSDGLAEIVVASDLDTSTCSGVYPWLPCVNGQYGGMISVVDSGGRTLVRRLMPGEVPFSSPSVGHLDGDRSLDIVISAGHLFSETNPSVNGAAGRRVWAFNRYLEPLAGWPVGLDAPTMSSPALTDVDGNGLNEVAVSDSGGRVYLLNGNGARRWSFCNRDAGNPCVTYNSGMDSSPVAADVDGDGTQEVLAVSEHTLRVFDGRGSGGAAVVERSIALNSSLPSLWHFTSTPAVFQAGGRTRVAVHGLDNLTANPTRDAGDRGAWCCSRRLGSTGKLDWPMFRHNAARTGSQVPLPPPVPVGQTAAGKYVAHAFTDLLGRSPDPAGQVYWASVVRSAGRETFIRSLVFADTCEWPRAVAAGIYRQVLQREPDPAGLAYWATRICSGLPARAAAIEIYGSPEYFSSPEQGRGTVQGFVSELYRDVLGRSADAAGLAYWVGQVVQRGAMAVAGDFYQSLESRTRRVDQQYGLLLKRAPDPGGRAHWAQYLLAVDDIVLTVSLTTSEEYYRAS